MDYDLQGIIIAIPLPHLGHAPTVNQVRCVALGGSHGWSVCLTYTPAQAVHGNRPAGMLLAYTQVPGWTLQAFLKEPLTLMTPVTYVITLHIFTPHWKCSSQRLTCRSNLS